MSEKPKETQGTVVQIADRRTSSGTKEGPGETPAEPKKPPADRNAACRPMPVNRNDVDPFSIIETRGGSGREYGRAVLILRDGLQTMRRAATVSFRQLSDLVEQLAERDAALRAWLARPWWRRWFRAPPELPPLMVQEVAEPQRASGETTQPAAPASGPVEG